MKSQKIVSFSLFEGFDNANTGIDNKEEIIKNLNKLLANTFVLYVKLLNFHWNVVSNKTFTELHEFFKDLYERNFDDSDRIAERVRALGGKPLASMKEFLENADLKENSEEKPAKVKEMIKTLVEDYETGIKEIRGILKDEKTDNATKKMLEDFIEQREKDAWMLRSNLEDKEE